MRVKLLSVLSLTLMVFYLVSCEKDKEKLLESSPPSPIYLGGSPQASGMDLSFDVVIQRRTTFQNGLTQVSRAWKKLQAVPQTESYSLNVTVNDGNFYMLKDNIVVQSEIRDRTPAEERIAKIEISGGISTAYNANNSILNSQPVGNLSQGFLDGVYRQYNNGPIDTASLDAGGIRYVVNGNHITIVSSIANGDEGNHVSTFNLSTGQPALIMSYDDNDPVKLTWMASHQYGIDGKPLNSVYTYYDYLADGDVRIKVEQWSYSNFTLNIY